MGAVSERLSTDTLVAHDRMSAMKLTFSTSLLFCSALFAALPVVPGGAMFENDQVKVVRALEKAHVKGKAHEHKVNRVMVYLQAGEQRFEYQDGRAPEVFHWKADQVKWSPSNGTHAPEVTGDESFNIIEVELKTPGANKAVTGPMDPVKLDKKDYSVEFENDQVRVVRVKVGAHKSTPMHEHATNRVTIFLTDQKFRITDDAGTVTSGDHKAGEAAWGTPQKHKEENLSDQPFEALFVELKS